MDTSLNKIICKTGSKIVFTCLRWSNTTLGLIALPKWISTPGTLPSFLGRIVRIDWTSVRAILNTSTYTDQDKNDQRPIGFNTVSVRGYLKNS